MAAYIINLSAEIVRGLDRLVGDERLIRDVPELLNYLAYSAADGVLRPDSWERDWISKATGVEL